MAGDILTHFDRKNDEDFPWSHPILNQYIIFMGRFPLQASEEYLKKYLNCFGQLAWFKLFESRDDGGYCYAHFIFAEIQSYYAIFSEPVHSVYSDGCRIRMWLRRSELLSCESLLSKRKIYVKNLASGTTQSDLFTYFSRFGTVTAVEGVKETKSNNSRFAFIVFDNEESISKCLSHKHPKINGLKLKCRYYQSDIDKNDLSLENQGRKVRSDFDIQFLDCQQFKEIVQKLLVDRSLSNGQMVELPEPFESNDANELGNESETKSALHESPPKSETLETLKLSNREAGTQASSTKSVCFRVGIELVPVLCQCPEVSGANSSESVLSSRAATKQMKVNFYTVPEGL